ncbi:hypothetical protein B0H13DRAFT_1861653 [Mycena leptocephala]|nr:hypothetical protein B0H13DRAFT_1861653 [Mycena leptocephala]
MYGTHRVLSVGVMRVPGLPQTTIMAIFAATYSDSVTEYRQRNFLSINLTLVGLSCIPITPEGTWLRGMIENDVKREGEMDGEISGLFTGGAGSAQAKENFEQSDSMGRDNRHEENYLRMQDKENLKYYEVQVEAMMGSRGLWWSMVVLPLDAVRMTVYVALWWVIELLSGFF